MKLFGLAVLTTALLGFAAHAADDVSGNGTIFGGGQFNSGAASDDESLVAGITGKIALRLSENFVMQGDLAVTRFGDSGRGNQINLNANDATTPVSLMLHAGYVDPTLALALQAGLTGAEGSNTLSVGLASAAFYGDFTLRSRAQMQNGDNGDVKLFSSLLGGDYFFTPNMVLSAEGMLGVTSVSGAGFSPVFNDADLVYQVGLAFDYRLEGSPISLGAAYGYFGTDSNRTDTDVHMAIGQVGFHFGSESLQDERQGGAVFRRAVPVLDTFLDGLL